MLRTAFLAAALPFSIASASAQILYSESFSLVTDTTRRVAGQIQPDLDVRTQRRLLVQFENRVDVSVRLGKSAFTVANKLEVARFGSETLLSGGYAYAEYRRLTEGAYRSEFHAQVQWADARGLDARTAAGYYARLRLRSDSVWQAFAGLGPFVERERWSYRGIDEEDRPAGPTPDARTRLKYGAYLAAKVRPSERWAADVSVYLQSAFDAGLGDARLALSAQASYRFTRYLSAVALYQNLYDGAPVVPIAPWYHRADFGLSVSF